MISGSERSVLSAKLWKIAEQYIVAEWICCDPVEPKHHLCAKGHAALAMVKTLLVDSDPVAPLLDAVLAEIRCKAMKLIPTDDFGQPVQQCFNCDDLVCPGCMKMSEPEQQMLTHALDLVQKQVFNRAGEYSAEDIAALENLKHGSVPDRRVKELEAALVHARNGLAELIDYVEDPGSNAYDTLHIVSQAISGIDPADAVEYRQLLAERDARIVDSVAQAISADSWSRRDRWGRYEKEEFESGMHRAEVLAEDLAAKVRDGAQIADSGPE